MPDSDWWRAEARKSAEDGHPWAALFAMANAVLGEDLAAQPALARETCPREWAQLVTYAEALGVSLPA